MCDWQKVPPWWRCPNLNENLASFTGLIKENEEHKHRRKFDPQELKLLVGEASNHFDELQQQNLHLLLMKSFRTC